MQRTRRRQFILSAVAQAPGRVRAFRIGFGYRLQPERADKVIE